MIDHEHDWYRVSSGRFVCIACGAPRRPAAPELTSAERAEVDRFGIHEDALGIGESI